MTRYHQSPILGAGSREFEVAGRPDARAADADRERVVELLRHAHGEGRLSLDEFDERATAAWAARTYRELAGVTADLPQRAPTDRPAPSAAFVDKPDQVALRIWLGVSVLNVLIWAVVSLAVGAAVYPWFVWVAGPWGVLLLIRRLAGTHGRRVVGAHP